MIFMPYHVLGIGIDDTFVMLGAWRRTSIHSNVPDRMAIAFTDAAVSITITSITDMLSFWIGIITPFPCVKIFCIYTGTYIHLRCLYFLFSEFSLKCIISKSINTIFIFDFRYLCCFYLSLAHHLFRSMYGNRWIC